MEEPKLASAFENAPIFSTKDSELFSSTWKLFILMKNNSSQKQFPCEVSALPQETVRFLSALLLQSPQTNPYDNLKEELTLVNSLSDRRRPNNY